MTIMLGLIAAMRRPFRNSPPESAVHLQICERRSQRCFFLRNACYEKSFCSSTTTWYTPTATMQNAAIHSQNRHVAPVRSAGPVCR